MSADSKKTKAQLIKELEKTRHRYAELERQVEHFETLFHNSPLPYQSLDESGNFLEVNQPWLDIMGYVRDEVIGRNFSEFLVPEWREHFKENFPRFKAMGEILGVEFEMVRKDSATILVAFNGRIGRTHAGAFSQTHCIFQDITELKSTEEALRQSEERLSLALDAVNDAVWDWRIDTGAVFFSNRWYTMLGYEPYELPVEFESWRKLLHPDDLKPSEDIVFGHIKASKSFELEFRMRHKDGSWRWIFARGKTVERDNEGRAIRMLGTHVDITERKQAEQELRHSENLLKMTQRIAKVGGWSRELTTGRTFWTEEHYRLLGYESGEVEPSKDVFMSHVHPEDKEYVSSERQAALDDIRDYDVEYRFIRKDGEQRYGRTFGRSEHAADGTPIFIYGAFRDVTDRKMKEIRLEDALKERESMLLEIHHRVKNNLTIILGLLDLTRFRATEDETVNFIKKVHGKISSMALIHNELYREETLTDIRIKPYLNQLTKQLMYLYEKKEVEIEIEGADISLVIEKAVPLGLIMNELITNAFKYAFPQGKSILRCKIHSEQDTVRITVSDDGPGLPDDFDPFTTKTLGYKLIRDIVGMQLHGELEVDGRDGTTVTITFPVS